MGVYMNRLKEIRSRLGLKQKDIAEKLHTTQQTVARWETGGAAIPVAQLKDLAALFGCSVDELLGIERQVHRLEDFARAEMSPPWGTVTVQLGDLERAYPIAENDLALLRKTFDTVEPSRMRAWIEFVALDNRLILLNPSFVTRLAWVSDDDEAMPFFVSPEAYKSFTDPTNGGDLGPVVLEERNALIRQVLQKSAADEVTCADENKVGQAMRTLTVIYRGGRSEQFSYVEETATSLQAFSASIEAAAPNTFVMVDNDGDNRVFINCSAVAVIEIPWEAHLGYAEDWMSGSTPSGSH
jgi:transcriptional regulator with XRE-family HTH domain